VLFLAYTLMSEEDLVSKRLVLDETLARATCLGYSIHFPP